jgi:hypothetical protein
MNSLNYDENYDTIIVAMELKRINMDLFDDYDEQIAMVNYACALYHNDERFKRFQYVCEFAKTFWAKFIEHPRAVREQAEFLAHNPFAKDEYILELLNDTAKAIV